MKPINANARDGTNRAGGGETGDSIMVHRQTLTPQHVRDQHQRCPCGAPLRFVNASTTFARTVANGMVCTRCGIPATFALTSIDDRHLSREAAR